MLKAGKKNEDMVGLLYEVREIAQRICACLGLRPVLSYSVLNAEVFYTTHL